MMRNLQAGRPDAAREVTLPDGVPQGSHLSFFDDGDEPRTATRAPRATPRRAPERVGRGTADDRTLLMRRAAAALVIVAIVVGVVFGVKALLDRQATQSLRDYVTNDVATVVSGEQANVRVPLFQQLDNAYNSANQSAVLSNIQQYVQQEQTYYRLAESWSVPAQMVGAQRQFVQALGLRYTALAKIDLELPNALGITDQATAIKKIAGDMEMLLAADVIYAERVKPLIEQELATAGITGVSVPTSAFLPDVSWVVPQSAAVHILSYVPSELGGAPLSGSVGHALLGVQTRFGAVSSTGVNSYQLGTSGVTFNLQVQNTGTIAVHDVITELRFFSRNVKNASCLNRTAVIPITLPGTTTPYTSPIVVAPTQNCTAFIGQPLTMLAEVQPLHGETNKNDNILRATVIFH